MFRTPVFEPASYNKSICARHQAFTKTIQQEAVLEKGKHHTQSYQQMHASLIHRGKNGIVKHEQYVGDTHHQLRATLKEATRNEAAGNRIVVEISVEIRVTNEGNLAKEYIGFSFPLKIPRANRPREASNELATADLVTYSAISDNDVLNKLSYLYQRGRAVLNVPDTGKHGHRPCYDRSKGDDQYVRHSEQTLAAYLCQPEAAMMIVNRITAEFRSRFPAVAFGSFLKVERFALHIHSNKTPCAPCEYVLMGLQNYSDQTPLQRQGEWLPFLQLLEREFNTRTTPHRWTYPKAGIRCVTTYTADGVDGDHKSRVEEPCFSDNEEATVIDIKDPVASKRIWLANLGTFFGDPETGSEVSSYSIISSGSAVSPETPKTVSRMACAANKELEDKFAVLALF